MIMPTPLIELKNVDLGYGRKRVLSNITFTIYEGDFFGMVGPNGAGKTTILKAILGTLKPQRGEMTFHCKNGKPVKFGYVPQRETIDQIMPFTVGDVVMMGRYRHLGLLKMPRREDKEKVMQSLHHVQIEDLVDVSFKDLSGGQKQRTLIARALASEPDVLVLDEPTNGMDLSSRTSILELVKTLHDEDQLTVIMVSHLLNDVANYVKRIAIVERQFFLVGNVDEVLTEQNLSQLYNIPVHVGELLGSTVILAGGSNV